jgi:hypothetical protein
MSTTATTLIAVLGTLGATTVTLAAQAYRDHGNRAQEDRRRFLREQLIAGADLWAACEVIRRRIDERPELWAGSVELKDEMAQFTSAFGQLQLLGSPDVIKAANSLLDRLGTKKQDGRIDADLLHGELRLLRAALRDSLNMDTPEVSAKERQDTEDDIRTLLPA